MIMTIAMINDNDNNNNNGIKAGDCVLLISDK